MIFKYNIVMVITSKQYRILIIIITCGYIEVLAIELMGLRLPDGILLFKFGDFNECLVLWRPHSETQLKETLQNPLRCDHSAIEITSLRR